jgi:predicted PurR-regulated permease PerM
MNESKSTPEAERSALSMRQAKDTVVQLVVGFLFVYVAYRILRPFVPLIVWGGVIAIAIYPLFSKLGERLGGRRKLVSSLLVLVAIGVIVAPVIAVSASLVETAYELTEEVDQGTLEIPPPPPRVKSWPLIGTKADHFWRLASENLQKFAETYGPQLKPVAGRLLAGAAGAGVFVIQLLVSVLIAGVFLIHAETSIRGLDALSCRIFGTERGQAFNDLSAKTVRSVATGVLGVAFILALLAGLGMLVAGVPYAGVWSVLVLLLAIMQLPPLIVLLPIAIWLFGSTDSQLVAWGFLVWSILVSLSDGALKAVFLGRGVDVPMLVILLGAIGGMILQGFIGLFIGAVALALFYQLLTEWLREGEGTPPTEPSTEAAKS